MIAGLLLENETPNGKVFYNPAVLTVKGVSKFSDDTITFREIQEFWSLPQNFTYSSAPRAEGTNLSDSVLHPGDVATFSLNLNPKRGENAKAGSYYHNIGAITPAGGESPIAVQAQHSAPQAGGSWASDTGSAPSGISLDAKIALAQYVKELTAILVSGDTVNAPRIIIGLGYESVDEANEACVRGLINLRNGLPANTEESEATEEDSPMVEAAVDLGADVIEEDVEDVSWD